MNKFIVFLAAFLISTFGGGFVVQKFWQWFIVATFGVNQLSLAQSIGLMLFVQIIFPMRVEYKEQEDFTVRTIATILYYPIVLSLGYFISLYI